MHMRLGLAWAALAVIAGSACTDAESTTDLNPAGPPMIRQVRLTERYTDGSGVSRTREVFAFGAHPLAESDEVHAVDTALAVGNQLRVVMDELLLGNSLEEIQCRGVVDADAATDFGRVPVGADPDDVARCAVPNDALAASCPGTDRRSVCICQLDAGCRRDGQLVDKGQPVGVRDGNRDGAADDTSFIEGAVGIDCGGIAVPIDLGNSYWNPSGNQTRPALGGFNALGPALVLVPRGPLPTSVTCRLTFADDVVDKQGVRVCAPPGGDVAADCAPGDVGAFQFGVEPLAIRPNSFRDNDVNVPRGSPLVFGLSAPVTTATLAGIQISPAPPGMMGVATPMPIVLRVDFTMPLAPQTQYTVTFPTTITDTFGRALPQVTTYRFTTGN